VPGGPTHAAFLRAVNLGSTRKTGSKELVACFEGAGLDEAATFRTSGNVVFAASGDAAKIKKQVEAAMEKEFGFEIPAFVRTAAQVKAIAKQKPFPAKAVSASKGKLQVALLEKKPAAKVKGDVLALASEEDRLSLKGTELYWLPSGGTQKSKLDMKTIDRALGSNTLRTMGTIEQLASKFF
jgi:uncharacterized protein (DUF1697 family)